MTMFMQATKVVVWSTDKEENSIGYYEPNPMLNTRVQDIIFPDDILFRRMIRRRKE